MHPLYNGASIYLIPLYPFISQSMIVPFMRPFISWSVHCLLNVSINLMEHPLMHPFIPHDASISFLFMLYIIIYLMHPFTSSLFIHLIQYRAVIIGFIIISATQIITSNNRILTIITKIT